MRKMRALFAVFAMYCCLAGCHKEDAGKVESPDLWKEFDELEGEIDLSRQNKYDEALLSKTWVFENGFSEVYVDGHLDSTTDITEEINLKRLVLNNDHKLSLTVSNGDEDLIVQGIWAYAYDCVLIKYALDDYQDQVYYELAELTAKALRLRKEAFVYDEIKTPFYRDPKGRHKFHTMVLKAE